MGGCAFEGSTHLIGKSIRITESGSALKVMCCSPPPVLPRAPTSIVNVLPDLLQVHLLAVPPVDPTLLSYQVSIGAEYTVPLAP